MPDEPNTETRNSGTRILFDLSEELRPEELEKFKDAANRAGANSLTDHFLNLTIRIAPAPQSAA